MPSYLTGRTRPTKPKKQARALKRKRDDVDVEKLQHAVDQLDPKAEFKSFTGLPLSDATKAGLKASHFAALTDIQSKAIPLALRGADILGAAKTGSGKTLAFLIPVLENLYRAQCVGMDAGLAAMIISPTRELATQIFEVLRSIGGRGHLFSAGCILGGKSLKEEQEALVRMNIVVCTPGRILQHLSQTAAFYVDNLKMLVLDEADRILDMGFQRDVDAIIDYLPKDRQTLLFSATQTKRVSDLARLSLQDPEYVSVHEAAASATPKTLQQNYVVTTLPEKLDTLWSFIQSTKKAKILVFLSSGKQVRFVYESFRHIQPGIPLLHLHGRQKMTKRLEVTTKFSAAKHTCLFSTDVVARGLDFPAVDWVVQVDCPEDADTYIHRVGRTARYEREGRAVLFLGPSEEQGMLSALEKKKVPIECINIRQKKQQSIKNQLQSMCFKNPQLKYLGQKAFISYVKSVKVMKDKRIFKLTELPLEEFAASLGLPGAPKIRFLKGEDAKERKNAPRQAMALSSDEEGEGENESDEDAVGRDAVKKSKKSEVKTKYDRMFARQNQDVLADHYQKLVHESNRDEEDIDGLDGEQKADDSFLTVKRRIPTESESSAKGAALGDEFDIDDEHKSKAKTVHIPGAADPIILDSKRREKLLKSKKKLLKLKDRGSKLVFDDEGKPHAVYEFEDEDSWKKAQEAEEQRKEFVEKQKVELGERDVLDKEAAREKRREKKRKIKERERAEKGDEGGVKIAGGDAFADFVADAGSSDDDEAPELVAAEPEEEERPKKKRKEKKWFEDDEEGEASKPRNKDKSKKKRPRKDDIDVVPETLEDLEKIAAGLLG